MRIWMFINNSMRKIEAKYAIVHEVHGKSFIFDQLNFPLANIYSCILLE